MVRPLFAALGVVFVGLGYVGYVVPGMPGTVFFILALWAFKKSSPRLEDWLMNRSFIGPTLRDWETDKSIRLGTKRLAISMVWASILFSCVVLWSRPSAPWLVPVLLACAAGVTVYIATRNTKA
ncbi:MAG: YbaN family protein [Fimbriimonas sp.]